MESLANDRIALLGQGAILDAEKTAYNIGPKCGACRHWRKTPMPRSRTARWT